MSKNKITRSNNQIFAHRGYTKNSQHKIAQNSIAALDFALKNNFTNIEFDLFFINNIFYICHDKPHNSQLKNLDQLTDYFKYKNSINYWCDFKNLDLKNYQTALRTFKNILQQQQIKLENIYFAPYNTNFKIAKILKEEISKEFGKTAKFMLVCDKIANKKQQSQLIQFITQNDIKYLSINSKILIKDKNFSKILHQHNINIFAWTIKSYQTFKALQKQGITNFASDIRIMT